MKRLVITGILFLVCGVACADELDTHFAGLIEYLYPEASVALDGGNVELRNESDGRGTQIHKWDLLAAKPSRAYLQSMLAEYLEYKRTQEQAEAAEKSAILSKINLTEDELTKLRRYLRER